MRTFTWRSLLGGADILWHLDGEPCAPESTKCAAFYSTRIGDQPSHGEMCRRCYVVGCGGWERDGTPTPLGEGDE